MYNRYKCCPPSEALNIASLSQPSIKYFSYAEYLDIVHFHCPSVVIKYGNPYIPTQTPEDD